MHAVCGGTAAAIGELEAALVEQRRECSALHRQLDDAYEDLAAARATAAEASELARDALAAAAHRERAMMIAVLQELRRHAAEAAILVEELCEVEELPDRASEAAEVGEIVARLEVCCHVSRRAPRPRRRRLCAAHVATFPDVLRPFEHASYDQGVFLSLVLKPRAES